MKFVAYWELNENNTPEEILKGALKIQNLNIQWEAGEITTWLVTVENWGITIFESTSAEEILNGFAQWRQAVPGCYKVVKCAPAVEVEEYAPKLMELVAKVNKA